jgi:hypothetical protein
VCEFSVIDLVVQAEGMFVTADHTESFAPTLFLYVDDNIDRNHSLFPFADHIQVPDRMLIYRYYLRSLSMS